MNEVDAIKNPSDILYVEEYLLKHHSQHYADIWRLGVNLALRITDLLSITMPQVLKAIRAKKLVLKEGKTGKTRTIALNPKALEILSRRFEDYPYFEYLFQSTHNRVKTPKPLTRQPIGDAFREAGRGIGVSVGTHTMRKTRGAILYQQGVPIETICKMLNHSSPAITMRYIGITQEQVDDTFMEVVL